MIIPYRDENQSLSFPILTITLIGVNIILFVVTDTTGGIDEYARRFGFIPNAVLNRPHVLLTSILLHANLFHLVSNIWFLWLFGDNIEDRFGRLPFLVLFVISGLIGNFTHGLFTMFQSDLPVVGASGAVAGVMGCYLVRFPKARIRCFFLLVFYPIFFRIKAVWFLGLWFLGEFLYAFLNPGDYIAHWAHIGGFGFGFIWAYGRRDKSPYPRGVWGMR